MYSLEKEIDKFAENFCGMKEPIKKFIANGDLGFFYAKYCINFDKVEEVDCFRSDHDFEEIICEQQEEIKQKAEKIFYEKVSERKLDHKDVQALEDICDVLKKNNNICKECIRKNGDECIVSRKNIFLQDTMECRNIYQFRPIGDIDEFHELLMDNVREALNNNFSVFRSYSKFLAVPLFKYTGGKNLYINRLSINTIEADIIASFFDWYDHFDEEGNELNHYYQESITLTIPLKELGAKELLVRKISNIFYQEDRDIDDIEMNINGVTVDISRVSRNGLRTYYNDRLEGSVKVFASYRKDGEILTTNDTPMFVVRNRKIVQLIRFIYYLKIFSVDLDKVDLFIENAVAGKYVDLGDGKESFDYILRYLGSKTNVEKERKQYQALFEERKPLYIKNYDSQGFSTFFDGILSAPAKYKNIFEYDFLMELLKDIHT